ncbi:MAG: pitrilysin family protein [Planctomycetota bacterium]
MTAPSVPASQPTFERFLLPGNLELRINSNRKLKTILAKVYVAADLDLSVTARALAPMVLRRGTENYPDMQALHRQMELLYGASIWSTVSKIGEWHVTRFQLEVVNDQFLPGAEGLFEDSLRLFHERVFQPRLDGGQFLADYVDQERESLRRSIESLIDEKSSYAAHRCIEEMCPNEAYRLGEQGRVEDLDAITPESLTADYQSWMRSAPISIYVAGDVDIEATRDMVANVFQASRGDGVNELSAPPSPVPVGELRTVREKLDVLQGKLVMGFRHGVTYAHESYEAMMLMNGILGSFSHSKLFQNVREKASLAYSASSWLEKSKGMLFISCGIANENFERARDISLEQVAAMQRGDISDEEIDSTRKTILSNNEMLEDSFSTLAAIDYIWGLHGRAFDLGELRSRLVNVTRDDIVAAANRLEHDMVYFLHGDEGSE